MALEYFSKNPLYVAPNGVPLILEGSLEANSQSFKAGQPVYLNSGAVTVVASDGTSVMGTAMKDATNVTSGNIMIPIMVWQTDGRLIVSVTNNGTDALSSTGTLNRKYAFYVSGNIAYLDINDTSNDALILEGHVYDQFGTASYRAWARPVYTILQYYAGY